MSATGRTEACLEPLFPSAHASSLRLLPDGTLLLAYFTGGEVRQYFFKCWVLGHISMAVSRCSVPKPRLRSAAPRRAVLGPGPNNETIQSGWDLQSLLTQEAARMRHSPDSGAPQRSAACGCAQEGGESVSIALARLPSGGKQWSRPVVVSQQTHRSNQNPVLVFDEPSGLLTLLHTSQAPRPAAQPLRAPPSERASARAAVVTALATALAAVPTRHSRRPRGSTVPRAAAAGVLPRSRHFARSSATQRRRWPDLERARAAVMGPRRFRAQSGALPPQLPQPPCCR